MDIDKQFNDHYGITLPGGLHPEPMATSTFVPSVPYADSSLPTFLLAMYLNQSPLRAERDIVFVRHLRNAMEQFAEAAAQDQGLEALRKLVWWNLVPVAPFAVWAYVIQQLCRTIANLLGQPAASLFTAKHSLTRESRLPKWQHNPSWNQYLSDLHGNEITEKCLSALIVEYSICLTASIRIFEAFVKEDLAKVWQSEAHTSVNAAPSVSTKSLHQNSGANRLAFGDPQVTVLNSPGIFIFEACTSAIETSYALAEQYPQATDKVQEAIATTLVITGILDMFPRRLQAVLDRMADAGKGKCKEGISQLRATAKEFSPAVREERPQPGASVFPSAVHAPVFVPRVYSGARPLALHIDDFEKVYGQV